MKFRHGKPRWFLVKRVVTVVLMAAAIATVSLYQTKVWHAININAFFVNNDEFMTLHHHKSKSRQDWRERMALHNTQGMDKGKYDAVTWEAIWTAHHATVFPVNRSRLVAPFFTALKQSLRHGLPSISPPTAGHPAPLAALVVTRNERLQDFEEWIHWHALMGMTHFFVYSNENPPEFNAHLDDLRLKGWVSWVNFPDAELLKIPASERRQNFEEFSKRSIQTEAYRDWLPRFQHLSTWIAKIDVDELLVPTPPFKSIRQVVQDPRFNLVKALRVNDYWMSTHGLQTRPNGTITENYFFASEKPHMHKTIARSAWVSDMSDPHDTDLHLVLPAGLHS